MTQIQKSKQIIRLHLAKCHNYQQSRPCEAIPYSCGECFGHWILKFEIYL